MKKVERNELLPLGDYEAVRGPFRNRVIAEKKRRRVKLGEHMSVVFENHDTVLLQIQEMLRTERISKEAAIAHELNTYNELVPDDDELSMTLFIEIVDKAERERMLKALAGMETQVFIEADGEPGLDNAVGGPPCIAPRRFTNPVWLASISVRLY